jgi:hypothetical protein
MNFQNLESTISVSLHICDKSSQFLHRNPLTEILIRVNDWLYHCRCLHEQLESLMSNLEYQLQWLHWLLEYFLLLQPHDQSLLYLLFLMLWAERTSHPCPKTQVSAAPFKILMWYFSGIWDSFIHVRRVVRGMAIHIYYFPFGNVHKA